MTVHAHTTLHMNKIRLGFTIIKIYKRYVKNPGPEDQAFQDKIKYPALPLSFLRKEKGVIKSAFDPY